MRNNKMAALVLAAASMAVLGCDNLKQKPVPFEDIDYGTAARDTTVYGICTDGLGMNTLQIVTDNGDTLTLNLATAREQGKVFGNYEKNDRMGVLVNGDSTEALCVINQSALLGDWVMENPLDGSSEVGIRIKEGGVAESINQPAVIYKSWRLYNGLLELVSEREGSGDLEEMARYQITRLDRDTLFFHDSDDRFEYGRQRLDQEEDLGIKFEDDEEDLKF